VGVDVPHRPARLAADRERRPARTGGRYAATVGNRAQRLTSRSQPLMTDPDPDVGKNDRRRLIAAGLRFDAGKTPAALLPAEVSGRSRLGRLQHRNDDHYLIFRLAQQLETIGTSLSSADLPSPFEQYAYAAVVADGIGEDGAGSIASRLALSTLASL